MLLSFLLTACDPQPAAPQALPPAPTEQPAMDLGPGGATVIRLIDRLDSASLTLPSSNLPEGEREPGTFRLTQGWESSERGRMKRTIWETDCPVRLTQKRYTAAPTGMTVRRGDEVLPYAPGLNLGVGAINGWEIQEGKVLVSSKDDPGAWPEGLFLVHDGTTRAERRLNFQASGLPAAAFVHQPVTIERDTRDALLLPAPAEASFKVAVPEGAHLRFGYTMAPSPVLAESAEARFVVRVDGEERWSDTADVSDGWQNADIDLSSYGGRTVTLVLATDPDGDASWDYAAFGTPELVGAPSATGPRRVVVVGVDTLRADHLGFYGYDRPTSPGLDALASQSIVFDHAYAPAPRTRPSFRTAQTGRWPLPAIHAPTLGQVLGDHGFATGGVVANVHLHPRMGFAAGYDSWEYENSALAEDQVDRALTWLQAHAQEDSYLFLHLMDPHLFYVPPDPYLNLFTAGFVQGGIGDRYNRWMVLRQDRRGDLSESNKNFMKARYDGEIAYTDRELMRLVTALDALPGKTLLVIHSDHGEEFWDHQSYEHNHTLYNELVHTVFLVRPPGGWGGGPHRVSENVSLVDLAPTLLDLVGVPEAQRPPTDGVSLAPYLDARRAAALPDLQARLVDRSIPIGHLMYDTERWAVVHGDGKYILQTISGEEELYDLKRDPGEQDNRVRMHIDDLDVWRKRLSQATGWPVGPGWRVDISGVNEPFTMVFDQPVIEAGVLDPEAARMRRANLEWGEKLQALPSEVATVTVQGNAVTVTPGPKPTGTIYVLGPSREARGGLEQNGATVPLAPSNRPMAGGHVRFQTGTLIIPRDSEAAHLGLDDTAGDDDASIEALRELGYME